ncbi:endonuclease domain-containing protein [Yinghuangia aomiensis]
MYEQHTKDVLRKGQHVRQTCGVLRCLRPAHLEVSRPRPGRTPLGEAGQYKGKQQRADHLERCAKGHEWTEETLYVDPAGRRVCRICQVRSHLRSQGRGLSEHTWKRRKSWEETPECANGHVYAEVGWYFNGEARICRACFANKERRRWLRVTYGLLPEDFAAKLIAQDFACYTCARPFDPDVHELTPCVDHSHASGRVRKLLCHSCNLALGHAKDNPGILRALADYLEQHADDDAAGESAQANPRRSPMERIEADVRRPPPDGADTLW